MRSIRAGALALAFVARDWLAKLRLVDAGLAITTVASSPARQLPDCVRTVTVRGGPRESRRLSPTRLPVPMSTELSNVAMPSSAGSTPFAHRLIARAHAVAARP